jgi:hypothetical protein
VLVLMIILMDIERTDAVVFFSFFSNLGGDALLFSFYDENRWMSSNLGS